MNEMPLIPPGSRIIELDARDALRWKWTQAPTALPLQLPDGRVVPITKQLAADYGLINHL